MTTSLNEGRGMNLGDTRTGCHQGLLWRPLNEGRGMNLGDTASATQTCPCPGPLNEGRGMNLGDTPVATLMWLDPSNAQRRPRYEPRRHGYRFREVQAEPVRSTKAEV